MFTIKVQGGLYFKSYIEETEELIYTDSEAFAMKFRALDQLDSYIESFNIQSYAVGVQ